MAIGIATDALAAAAMAADLGPGLFPRPVIGDLRAIPDALLAPVVAAAADELVRDYRGAHDHGAESSSEPSAAGVTQLKLKAAAHWVPVQILRNAYAAICCILVRSARENPSSEASQMELIAELGVHDPEVVERLLPCIRKHIADVRAVLCHSSFDFSHVVDVSWRLDYVLQSSAEGAIHAPQYLVQLTLQPPEGPMQTIEFTCSVDGLRDLVYRLQDAANTIEKLGGGVDGDGPPGRSRPRVPMGA